MGRGIDLSITLPAMETYGQRVRKAREAAEMSQGDLAGVLNIKQPSLHAIETHPTATSSRHTLGIAKATGVTPEWLETGAGEDNLKMSGSRAGFANRHSEVGATTQARSATNVTQEEMLKVLGMAEGGPDGWNLWNGEVVQYIPRPANLVGVPGAYAVYVRGESMKPRYLPGELAHINPAKPVSPGNYVLVQRKPKQEGDSPLAVVKLLIRRTASKLILGQHNPEKEIEVPASEVMSIHRVVGSSEA